MTNRANIAMSGDPNWIETMQVTLRNFTDAYGRFFDTHRMDVVGPYLIQRAAVMKATYPGRDWAFDSTEHLLLEEGREFRRILPTMVEMGNENECFANACRLVRSNPQRYAYCEGYAFAGAIPVHHAWAIDRHTGMVVDNTWPDRWAKERNIDWQYFGLPIQSEYMLKALLGGAGTVLDDFAHDYPIQTGLVPLEEVLHGDFKPLQRGLDQGQELEVDENGYCL
jgi:hypothetical protein